MELLMSLEEISIIRRYHCWLKIIIKSASMVYCTLIILRRTVKVDIKEATNGFKYGEENKKTT